ncbi:MAG: DUF202 domain-containing protein [Nanoarchaeota archaeon]
MKKRSIQNELSEERTVLSNERTLLSYIQTSLATFAFAFFLFKFADGTSNYSYIGALSIILGIIFITIGLIQYKRRKILIKKFRNHVIEIE